MSRWFEKRAGAHTEWVYRGRDAFLQDISSPEIRALYEGRMRGDPTIVLYGPTQVGKTELLLQMLGVDISAPTHMCLKRALRGGRPEGESATSTATIYSMHDGNDYIFETPSDWNPKILWQGSKVAELQEHVANVRNSLSLGGSISTLPIQITLPAWVADHPTKDISRLRIIDLPGFGSHDNNEHAQVNALLAAYLPSAVVVVLVFDAMKCIEATSLVAGDFFDWKYDPCRYRLVLTRSLSPNDVQERKPKDIKALKFYYRKQLGPIIPKETRIFPIEYGKTWWTFANINPEMHGHFQPVFAKEIKKLVDDLPEPSPIQAIFGLQHYWKKLEHLVNDLEQEKEREISELKEKEKSVESEIGEVNKELEKAKAKNDKLKRPLVKAPEFSLPPLDTIDCQTAKHFMNHLNTVKDALEYEHRKYAKDLGKYGYKRQIEISEDVKNIIIACRDGMLDSGLSVWVNWVKRYLLPSAGKEEEARLRTRACAQKAKAIALQTLRDHQRNAQKAADQRYTKEQEKRKHHLDVCKEYHAMLLQDKETWAGTRQQTDDALQSWRDESKESLRLAKQFDFYLRQELKSWSCEKLAAFPSLGRAPFKAIEHGIDVLLAYRLARSRDIS